MHRIGVVQEEGSSGDLIAPAAPLHRGDSAAAVLVDGVPGAPMPEVGWDLQMRPQPLNDSFWREQACRYAKWDAQVAVFTTLLTLAVTLKHLNLDGAQHAAWMLAPAWINQFGWLAALWHGRAYQRHRLPILTAVKVGLALASLHCTNQIRDRLYGAGPLTRANSAVSLIVKIVLISNAPQIPCEVLRMPLPFWQQLGCTALKAGVLFLGGCTRDLIRFSNIRFYLEVLDGSSSWWARLVQSNMQPMVAPAAVLQGRSTSMVQAMLTLYISTVAVTVYLAYMCHWMELRAWLRQKMRLAPYTPPGAPARPVYIDGVPLTKQHLQDMLASKFATVLLDGRGVLGRVVRGLLHLGALNMVCLMSLLTSQVLALHVVPRLLPASMFHMYYPHAPESEGGMCSPDSAPVYSGWFGGLLWALGS